MPGTDTSALLIANPVAGRGRAPEQAASLAQALSLRGWTATVRHTEHPTHAVQLVRAGASTHGTVVAVGGDGTACEVATALLRCGHPNIRLALLPCGTGNDTVHQFGFRTPRDTWSAVVSGQSRRVDAIEVSLPAAADPGPHFALSFVAAGFAAELVQRTTPTVKRWFGRRLAYSIGFLRALSAYQTPEVVVRFNGQEVRGRFLHLCAANTEWAGGGVMRIAPGARIDDARLNLCLIGAKGRCEILRNFHRLLRGTFPSQPGVLYTEGAALEILGDTPLPLQIDGSPAGVTPVRCRIRPGALRLAAHPGQSPSS